MKLKDAMKRAVKYGYSYLTIDDNGDLYAFENEPVYGKDEDGGFWDKVQGDDTRVLFLSESNYIGDEYNILDLRELKN